jgi:hypothetical protein
VAGNSTVQPVDLAFWADEAAFQTGESATVGGDSALRACEPAL